MLTYARLLLGYAIYAVAAVIAIPAVILAHVAETIGDFAEDILGDL